MNHTLTILVIALALPLALAAQSLSLPARVFILHPTLVTDEAKEANFARDYLKRWAKKEILLVDSPEGADVTVEILRLDAGIGAGKEDTRRGIFGGVTTTKENAPMTTTKICIEKPSEQGTEMTKERLNMPDAIKKFVKDNAAKK
jgi:hypothetical protein